MSEEKIIPSASCVIAGQCLGFKAQELEQQRDELLLAMGVLRANIDDDYYKLYIDGVLTKVKPT